MVGDAEIKSLQIWLGNKPMPKSNVREFYPNYTLLRDLDCLPDGIKKITVLFPEYWMQSDVLRFWYLSQHPDVLYADLDVKISGLLKLENRLSFGHVGKLYDYHIIYNANETKRCSEILSQALSIKGIGKNGVPRAWLHRIIGEPCGKIIGYTHGNVVG